MNPPRNISDRFLYAVLILCIFSFKVVVLGVGESGVRIDDPVILLAVLVLLFRGDLFRIKRSRAINIYLGFIGASFLSVAWNVWHGRVEWLYATLFVVRLLEYLVFYYIGHSIARTGADLTRVLRIYLVTLSIVVPLQSIHVLPVPNAFDVSRASGNTNGPYELAAVAAFLLCYLGYRGKERLGGAAALILIVLSGARTTFVGAAISLVKVQFKQSSRQLLRFALFALPMVLLVALLGSLGAFRVSTGSPYTKIELFNRLSTSTSVGTMADLAAVYEASPTYQNSSDYSDGAFANASMLARESEGDASGLVRVFRWSALLKSALENTDTTLIGLGPSFGTSAVDGYFVRAFVETGITGLCLFLWFAWALVSPKSNSPWQFNEFVFMLLVTAISIDIFVSYKTMLFLWLWHGMNEYSVLKIPERNLAPPTSL